MVWKYIFTSLTLVSRVLKSEKLVRWYLSHGADPNAQCRKGSTTMTAAVIEAPLPIIKLLVEHGGQVKGTDLVAQALIGDSRGEPGRIQVIEYLLELGAPIGAISGSAWKLRDVYDAAYESSMKDFLSSGNERGKTALHIAKDSETRG
jgi:ankyrin repeat protein